MCVPALCVCVYSAHGVLALSSSVAQPSPQPNSSPAIAECSVTPKPLSDALARVSRSGNGEEGAHDSESGGRPTGCGDGGGGDGMQGAAGDDGDEKKVSLPPEKLREGDEGREAAGGGGAKRRRNDVRRNDAIAT